MYILNLLMSREKRGEKLKSDFYITIKIAVIAAPLDTNCRTFQNCDLLPETVVFSPLLLHDDNSFDIWSIQSHLVTGTDESTYGWTS